MKVVKDRAGDRIIQLGHALFGVTTVDETIEALKAFFKSLGSPVNLKEAGIDVSKKEEILNLMNRNRAQGLNYRLTDEEREELLSYIV